jgi:hypothetical protein
VTSIGWDAFAHCSGLTGVTLGSGITTIQDNAFAHCTGLTNVTIPKSVTSIEGWAFFNCASLNAITVDSLNSAYSSTNGILFNKNKTVLIQYPANKAGSYYNVPGSVTNIASGAFACSGLTSLVVPDSVKTIGGSLFNNSSSLTSLTLGNGVTSIGGDAFRSCRLTSVTFPASLTYIGDWAFADCETLKELYFKGNAPARGQDVYYGGEVFYYVPGTTGWGATLDGLVVWNQTNLVLNSSFEAGGAAPASWTRGGSAAGSSAAAQSGTNSLRIATAGANAPTTQTIAIQAGTTYDISVWINAAGLTAGPVIFDTGDKYDGAGQGQFVISSANSGWTKYSGKFTATNTSVTLRMFTESGFSGTVCFDNVVLTPATQVPSPWHLREISTVGKSGGTTYNNGTFTLKGAGKTISSVSDSFHFVHQISSGDCDIKVKVLTLTNTASAAKSGVAIRETLNGNARAAGVWVTPTNGIIFTARTATGGTTTNTVSTGKKAPYWVRLTRTGNSFKAYYGTTGTNWTQLGATTTISMTTNAYIGMGLCSGDTNKLAVSTISSVTATP